MQANIKILLCVASFNLNEAIRTGSDNSVQVKRSDSKEEFFMNKTQMRKQDTKTMVLGAVFTALVVVLQFMGAFIKFGPFSISLVLIPIVLGAATCGVGVGTWLGFIFGVVVLISGDAAAFLAVNAAGTVITVLLKGMLCGFLAGYAYRLTDSFFKKRATRKTCYLVENGKLCQSCKDSMNDYFSRNCGYIAVVVAAVVCPLVNTGVFLLGCLAFFMPTVAQWAEGAGMGSNVGAFMLVGLVGFNFLFELGTNIILSPVVVRLLNIRKKMN